MPHAVSKLREPFAGGSNQQAGKLAERESGGDGPSLMPTLMGRFIEDSQHFIGKDGSVVARIQSEQTRIGPPHFHLMPRWF
jgi:hypothetical protein